MYSNEGFVENPVPVNREVHSPSGDRGSGEMLVIARGAVIPLILKLAVPSTCPVNEYGQWIVVPPLTKSCVHPTKLSPLAPGDAVNVTVPMLKNASTLPNVPLGLVPIGEDVTVSSLPPIPSGQYVAVPIAGSTMERKLGV